MGSNRRSAVLILFMENQWASTKLTLKSFCNELIGNSEVVLLLNGSDSREIAWEFESLYPNFKLYVSKSNLGVAGGRNFLLQTVEARSADYIFHLDNDVIISSDYFNVMIHFLESRPDAGVVGPLVFQAHPILLYFLESNIASFTKSNGHPTVCCPKLNFASSRVISDWATTGFPSPWHFGVSENWRFAYCSTSARIINRFFSLLGINPPAPAFHIHNPSVSNTIKSGSKFIRSSNIAGCGTLYKRELIDDIGFYDETFNPYSLEDVELCVRAMKAGYTNYVNPEVAIFHGTDTRSLARKTSLNINQKIKTFILLRRRLIAGRLSLAVSLASYLSASSIWVALLSLRSFSLDPFREFFRGIADSLTSQRPTEATGPCMGPLRREVSSSRAIENQIPELAR